MRNNSGVAIIGDREKIIQLLKNPLVIIGYRIEIMSMGDSTRKLPKVIRVKEEENPLIIFESRLNRYF